MGEGLVVILGAGQAPRRSSSSDEREFSLQVAVERKRFDNPFRQSIQYGVTRRQTPEVDRTTPARYARASVVVVYCPEPAVGTSVRKCGARPFDEHKLIGGKANLDQRYAGTVMYQGKRIAGRP